VRMKHFVIAALLISAGCAAAVKLPGTKDPETERVQALVRAIEKQSDAIVAIAGAKASPSPTPAPTVEPVSMKSEKPEEGKWDHFGEDVFLLKAETPVAINVPGKKVVK
jgi:hypothetical protein